MWSYEPFVGTTLYLTRPRTTSLATTVFWEFHSEKEDTNVKVGQILTFEGGAGKSFLGGGLIVGAAYYAQWKLTEDRCRVCAAGRRPVRAAAPNKHKVFGFGPDVTLPIASGSKLFALVNVRYFWETGASRRRRDRPLSLRRPFPVPSQRAG